MSETLKPCPFCGETPEISAKIYSNNDAGCFYVECSRVCILTGFIIWAEDILQAYLIWNKRGKPVIDAKEELINEILIRIQKLEAKTQHVPDPS